MFKFSQSDVRKRKLNSLKDYMILIQACEQDNKIVIVETRWRLKVKKEVWKILKLIPMAGGVVNFTVTMCFLCKGRN